MDLFPTVRLACQSYTEIDHIVSHSCCWIIIIIGYSMFTLLMKLFLSIYGLAVLGAAMVMKPKNIIALAFGPHVAFSWHLWLRCGMENHMSAKS